jgi:aconitate hydratase
VVAYALAGWITRDLTSESLGEDPSGNPVYLKDIWPTEQELQETMLRAVTAEMFRRSYNDVFKGDERWQTLPVPEGSRYVWDVSSTYIQRPPFVQGMTMTPSAPVDLTGARVLALLGDSVTTDHISPAGSIKPDSPAGAYLIANGVKPADFNSYGARRGNHEVMMRGTFANVRLRNQLAPGTEGGWTNVPAWRRADDDLRRVDEVPDQRGAAVRDRRQGIRVRIIARLGGRRGRCCSASRRSSPNRSSGFTAAIW